MRKYIPNLPQALPKENPEGICTNMRGNSIVRKVPSQHWTHVGTVAQVPITKTYIYRNDDVEKKIS